MSWMNYLSTQCGHFKRCVALADAESLCACMCVGWGYLFVVACVQTPLALAAKAGCVPAVKMLIAAGANIDHKDDDVEVGTR